MAYSIGSPLLFFTTHRYTTFGMASEILQDNSEKCERFQRKSEKSTCLFYTFIRLFWGSSFDCIVTEPTKKGTFENG